MVNRLIKVVARFEQNEIGREVIDWVIISMSNY
jgi:hypothetical protein